MGVQDTLFSLTLALAFTACIKYLSVQDLHSCLEPCCQDKVTALFVEFEPFATTLDAVVEDLLAKCPGLHVVVASEEFPYPPPRVVLEEKVELLLLNPTWGHKHPQLVLEKPYLVLFPDSASISNATTLALAIKELFSSNYTFLALPAFQNATCSKMSLDVKRWTLTKEESTNEECQGVDGRHTVLLSTESFFSLPRPFMRPIPESLYIQGLIKHWRGKLHSQAVVSLPAPTWEKRVVEKHSQYNEAHRRHLYHEVGVKLVAGPRGMTEWFGCTKDTPRCFPSIDPHTEIPQYLFAGRWTPPCCLKALRKTTLHVFQTLDHLKVRYWLEGGSLLGAVRNGDIIPWDYDVDLGVYREDLQKLRNFSHLEEGPLVDQKGFVWEKAREGDFFRVHYGVHNRVHVDLFPFESRDGTMTKDFWFESHPQDREFPESFLQPIERMPFLGYDAPVPNRVKEFLELKFGAGVVEHPSYPSPHFLPSWMKDDPNLQYF